MMYDSHSSNEANEISCSNRNEADLKFDYLIF